MKSDVGHPFPWRFLLALFAAWWFAASATSAEPQTTTGQKPPNNATPQAKQPESPEKKDSYLRLRRDQQGRPVAMEVATVRFQSPQRGKHGNPLSEVDLVGAVHVAEPEFFAALNKQFNAYDAVLYELVAPEGTRPSRDSGSGSGSPISSLQTALTQILNLQFQLEGIDYRRPNMVHADLSPEEFTQAMRNRGETVWSMFLRMLVYSSIQQAKNGSGASDLEVLMALLDKNRSLALKRVMAKQFEDLGGAILVIDGPEGSALIRDRNTKALDVLRRELNAGKRKVAIFYGAGHLPDLAKRLADDFDMKPVEKVWLRAWDMSEPAPKKPPAPSKPQTQENASASPRTA
ncbi:MAG: hypothetical protein JW719_06580 [Pirellulales bacterium]|nr:hypothetical protein [Pirellulales bacterium]